MIVADLMSFAQRYYSKGDFTHAMRVACFAYDGAKFDSRVEPEEAFLVGIAHDLIEDTDCPQEQLMELLGEDLFTSVVTLTKDDRESYEAYITRVLDSKDPVAFLVKRADMRDHLSKIETLTDKRRDKYLPVLQYFL